MRLIAVIEDPAGIERILKHVGLWQRGRRVRAPWRDDVDRAAVSGRESRGGKDLAGMSMDAR
jgi:hypothetical protein